MRIDLKVIVFGLIFFLLYLGMSYVYLSNSLTTLYNTKYEEVSNRMKRELEVLIKEKHEAILILDILLAQNEDVKDLLLTNNSDNLKFDDYSLSLKENTSLKNIWFNIVDDKGISLYRSWTKKKGDSLLGIRPEIADMIENPQVFTVISTGRFSMTFKSMVPVYNDGKFIGSVETIAGFKSIINKLKKYKFETLILIDNAYKEQLTYSLDNSFIQDYYTAGFSGSDKLMESVLEKGVEHFLDIDTYMIDRKNKQLICLYKLPDINGKDMGYFIMALDLNDINISSIEDSKKRIIIGLVLVFFVITGFLLYLYMVNYKNFLQRQRRELEETVVRKTKELREQSKEMEHLAHHDSLTSLPNRLYFDHKLKVAIRNAKLKSKKVGVLFLDLDRFKEVNDSYGHEKGDLLLRVITQRLQKIVREEDIIARLGGDEFTIIVHNAKQRSLEKIAQKIMSEIKKPIFLDEIELFVTFSIGISIYPQDGESSDLLLKNADTAMYRAKEKGKNGYQFYNLSMTEITMAKLGLQNSLYEAIRLNQFVPYYQPKIDARSGKVVGLEGLVRWIHPQRGVISPFEFIPYAEEIGLIAEIDKIMLRLALRQMKEWHKKDIATGCISLNISSKQLENFICVEDFKKALTEIDLDSKYLELEVTESQIMKNQDVCIEVLNKIKELGISIAMDDFGTGYSSLAYLKNLPVETLKIDRSFIKELPNEEDDIAIIKTIIALANNLQLDLIAEGVETKEQIDFLLKEGCYKIQGYYYSKPLPAKECEAFLIENMQNTQES